MLGLGRERLAGVCEKYGLNPNGKVIDVSESRVILGGKARDSKKFVLKVYDAFEKGYRFPGMKKIDFRQVERYAELTGKATAEIEKHLTLPTGWGEIDFEIRVNPILETGRLAESGAAFVVAPCVQGDDLMTLEFYGYPRQSEDRFPKAQSLLYGHFEKLRRELDRISADLNKKLNVESVRIIPWNVKLIREDNKFCLVITDICEFVQMIE